MDQRLALAIPTYNRSGIFRDNLEAMLPELIETGIPVYISDDSTDDGVETHVTELTAKYPYIYYQRNVPRLGHDKNCLRTLSMPDAEYVWYLGDGLGIKPGGIKRILTLIKAFSPDFLAVAADDRQSVDLPAGLYRDHALLLERLAWHLTLTGATIYHRRFLVDKLNDYIKFQGTNFIQLGIVLQNLPILEHGFYWTNEVWLNCHTDKGNSYWQKKVFDVFVKCWSDFILGLSSDYPTKSKLFAIREHSRRTGLLEWRGLTHYHRRNLLTLQDVHKHRHYWKLVSGVPLPIIAALSVVPPGIMRFIRRPLGGGDSLIRRLIKKIKGRP